MYVCHMAHKPGTGVQQGVKVTPCPPCKIGNFTDSLITESVFAIESYGLQGPYESMANTDPIITESVITES